MFVKVEVVLGLVACQGTDPDSKGFDVAAESIVEFDAVVVVCDGGGEHQGKDHVVKTGGALNGRSNTMGVKVQGGGLILTGQGLCRIGPFAFGGGGIPVWIVGGQGSIMKGRTDDGNVDEKKEQGVRDEPKESIEKVLNASGSFGIVDLVIGSMQDIIDLCFGDLVLVVEVGIEDEGRAFGFRFWSSTGIFAVAVVVVVSYDSSGDTSGRWEKIGPEVCTPLGATAILETIATRDGVVGIGIGIGNGIEAEAEAGHDDGTTPWNI